MARHRVKFNRYLNGMKLDTTSSRLFEKYGIENCKIELIENYPCNSKEELLKREGEYIRNIDCVNRGIAGRTWAEWVEEHKEQVKECKKKWYKNNEELAKQRAKEHRDNNIERYKEVKKKYREEHKEELKQKKAEYYQKNKEKWYEIIVCECGSSITRGQQTSKINQAQNPNTGT